MTDSILNPEIITSNAGAGGNAQPELGEVPHAAPIPALDLAAERELMARIFVKWGAAIAAACHTSSVPPEFLAALIANESGGKLSKPPRFEPSVYARLLAVQAGKQSQADLLHHRPAHYGSITTVMLRGKDDNTLRAYSSSWGLTQIMGYHTLGNMLTVGDLLDPKKNLAEAIHMLARFCQEFTLQPSVEFEEMFRCWNTGQPRDNPATRRIEGKTYDPHYVDNGLRRLVIYREMFGASTHPPVTDVMSGDL